MKRIVYAYRAAPDMAQYPPLIHIQATSLRTVIPRKEKGLAVVIAVSKKERSVEWNNDIAVKRADQKSPVGSLPCCTMAVKKDTLLILRTIFELLI